MQFWWCKCLPGKFVKIVGLAMWRCKCLPKIFVEFVGLANSRFFPGPFRFNIDF